MNFLERFDTRVQELDKMARSTGQNFLQQAKSHLNEYPVLSALVPAGAMLAADTLSQKNENRNPIMDAAVMGGLGFGAHQLMQSMNKKSHGRFVNPPKAGNATGSTVKPNVAAEVPAAGTAPNTAESQVQTTNTSQPNNVGPKNKTKKNTVIPAAEKVISKNENGQTVMVDNPELQGYTSSAGKAMGALRQQVQAARKAKTVPTQPMSTQPETIQQQSTTSTPQSQFQSDILTPEAKSQLQSQKGQATSGHQQTPVNAAMPPKSQEEIMAGLPKNQYGKTKPLVSKLPEDNTKYDEFGRKIGSIRNHPEVLEKLAFAKKYAFAQELQILGVFPADPTYIDFKKQAFASELRSLLSSRK